jgi:hypothetical protein
MNAPRHSATVLAKVISRSATNRSLTKSPQMPNRGNDGRKAKGGK